MSVCDRFSLESAALVALHCPRLFRNETPHSCGLFLGKLPAGLINDTTNMRVTLGGGATKEHTVENITFEHI